MRKIYKFKLLTTFNEYCKKGEVFEGYHTPFMGAHFVMLLELPGLNSKLGVSATCVEQLEFVREEPW